MEEIERIERDNKMIAMRLYNKRSNLQKSKFDKHYAEILHPARNRLIKMDNGKAFGTYNGNKATKRYIN